MALTIAVLLGCSRKRSQPCCAGRAAPQEKGVRFAHSSLCSLRSATPHSGTGVAAAGIVRETVTPVTWLLGQTTTSAGIVLGDTLHAAYHFFLTGATPSPRYICNESFNYRVVGTGIAAAGIVRVTRVT
jgi:hypothetical protein